MDKVVVNKETRIIARITKNVRKYKKVIAAHHVIALFEALGLEVPLALRSSPNINTSYSEKLELSKNLISKIFKTLELEGFVRILLIEVLWKDGNL